MKNLTLPIPDIDFSEEDPFEGAVFCYVKKNTKHQLKKQEEYLDECLNHSYSVGDLLEWNEFLKESEYNFWKSVLTDASNDNEELYFLALKNDINGRLAELPDTAVIMRRNSETRLQLIKERLTEYVANKSGAKEILNEENI